MTEQQDEKQHAQETDNEKTASRTERRQRRWAGMIVALLEHPTVARAAEAAGVSEATMRRARKQPEFRRQLRRAQREALSQATLFLQQGSLAAATTLVRILRDAGASPQTRLRAATVVCTYAFRLCEREDQEARVEQLERTSRKPRLVVAQKAGDAANEDGRQQKKEQGKRILHALLTHTTVGQAAQAAGVSSETVWRYRRTRRCQRELRQARQEALSQASMRLQQAAPAAVNAILRILAEPGAPAAAVVMAGKLVLEQSWLAREDEELRARLDQLEASAHSDAPASRGASLPRLVTMPSRTTYESSIDKNISDAPRLGPGEEPDSGSEQAA